MSPLRLHVLCFFLVSCGDSSSAEATDTAVETTDDGVATDTHEEIDSAAPDAVIEMDSAVEDSAIVDSAVEASATDVGAKKSPSLGAHTLAFYRYHANDKTSITTSPLAASAGSTLIVGVGRGDISAFALPTNNKVSTPFTQLGTTHSYTKWMSSGTASYALGPAAFGPGLTVTSSTAAQDEITLAAVEVRDSTKIQQFVWSEVLSAPLKSKSVTTTGPATLIAFWWGDAFVDYAQTAVPNNGFTVIDSLLEAGSLVQCAVAAKTVSAAGTYDVTWTATPDQGAQLWLIAVQ
jgi:hypothetical protein